MSRDGAIEVGVVEGLFRYAVKSMRGQALDAAELDFHGVQGDRRLALRRVEDRSSFPWLTAGRLPELVLYTPVSLAEGAASGQPTHVRTPDGRELELFGEALAADVAQRWGGPVQLMPVKHGVFDEASLSVLSVATIEALASLSSLPADVRRYRPNLLVRSLRGAPYEEDGWVGGTLSFGEGPDAAAVAITLRDERCAMVNIDPDTAQRDPALQKAIVRARDNLAGVYGTVTRRGRLALGQRVFHEPAQRR